jgi:PEP-CTERM motif-containing protein
MRGDQKIMKRIRRSDFPKYCFVIAVVTMAVSLSASAASYGNDNAGNYTSWTSGSNQGVGLGAWAFSNTGTSSESGEFLGDSTANGSGGHLGINSSNGDAWGLYGNNGQTASAVRPFTGALSIGQSVSITWENGFVQTGGTEGLGLQDSEGDNLLELFFVGGNGAYTLYNGTTTNGNTGIGFTDTGLVATFTLASSTTMNVTVTGTNGNSASYSTNGIALESQTDMSVAQIRFFNANGGSGGSQNDFYNNLVVPEPSTITLVGVGLLGALGLIRRRKA